MKENNIDCMKYRTSSHLAGVDVDTTIAEKGKCILTIKEAYYSKAEIVNGKKQGENVNGKILDGYFLTFLEDVKPMMVNSGNRKAIAGVVKTVKNCSSVESRNLLNWVGVQIELLFDETIKFGNEVTGGIVVKKQPVIREKKSLNDAQFQKALDSIKAKTFTKESLLNDFLLTTQQTKTAQEL